MLKRLLIGVFALSNLHVIVAQERFSSATTPWVSVESLKHTLNHHKGNTVVVAQLRTSCLSELNHEKLASDIIVLPAHALANIEQCVIRVSPFQPGWKRSKDLIDLTFSGDRVFAVKLFSFANEETVSYMNGKRIEAPFDRMPRLYLVRLTADELKQTLDMDGVQFVQPHNGDPQALMEASRGGMGVNQLHYAAGTPLKGKGVVIGIGDESPAQGHTDNKERELNFNNAKQSSHSNLVAGIAAGAGIIDNRAIGVAPEATFISNNFTSIVYEAFNYYKDYGMNITNNSYGLATGNCVYFGAYDMYSEIADTIANHTKNVLHVFAAGNNGNLTCSPMPAGYNTVLSSFQTAKNVLTVGNYTKYNVMWNTSAKGPTDDFRIKPEVVAYGANIFATDNTDKYTNSFGTSMSAPAVSGVAALLTERFKALHGNQLPAADVLKAVLIGTSDDVETEGPDYKSGFGKINAPKAIQCIDSGRYIIDSITNGSNKQFTINVPSSAAQVRVLLYWHDLPGVPNATNALMNDLDLTVVKQGTTYYPYVLGTTASTVTQAATRGVDRKNNVEQVVVNNINGQITINVNGYSVSGTQRFVVVYEWLEDDIVFMNPNKNVGYANTDSFYIHWYTPNLTNSTYDLSYYNPGTSAWVTLNAAIPANRRHHAVRLTNFNNWTVFKMVHNGKTYYTDTVFVAARPTFSMPADQCIGSVNMQWAKTTNATGYLIWQKIGDQMVTIDTLPGTATKYTFIAKDVNEKVYLAVQPMYNTVLGPRSLSRTRVPNTGTCGSNSARKDLVNMGIIANKTHGRLYTSQELDNTDSFGVEFFNASSTDTVKSITFYTRIDDSHTWDTVIRTVLIRPKSYDTVYFSNFNISPVGEYDLTIVSKVGFDTRAQNDTARLHLSQLPNPAIPFGQDYIENFDSVGYGVYNKNQIGFGTDRRLDFISNTDYGRVQVKNNSGSWTLSGSKHLTLDVNRQVAMTKNELISTINLSNYSVAADQLVLSMEYMFHGVPLNNKDSNRIFVRGNDMSNWIPVDTFTFVYGQNGKKRYTDTVSLTNALISAGQNFSASTQIKIVQMDSLVASLPTNSGGITIDQIHIRALTPTMALTQIFSNKTLTKDAVKSFSPQYNINNASALKISNATMYMQVNGKTYSDVVKLVEPNTTIVAKFKAVNLNVSAGQYTAKYWIDYPNRGQNKVDTIKEILTVVNNNGKNNKFFADFENGSDDLVSNTVEVPSSFTWQQIRPNSQFKVSKPTSGAYAWALAKTSPEEQPAHLYLPAFDFSDYTQPMLSFNSIEHSDYQNLTIEYSLDGNQWRVIADDAYLTSKRNVGNQKWQLQSASLPKADNVFLRLAVKDPAVNGYWVAVDDIHVYDFKHAIYNGSSTEANTTYDNAVTVDNAIIAQADQPVQVALIKDVDQKHLINEQTVLGRHWSYVFEPSTTITHLDVYISEQDIKEVEQFKFGYHSDMLQSMSATITSGEHLMWHNQQQNTLVSSKELVFRPYGLGYEVSIPIQSAQGFISFHSGAPWSNYVLGERYFSLTSHPGQGSHQGQLTFNWQLNAPIQMSAIELQLYDADTVLKHKVNLTQGQNTQVSLTAYDEYALAVLKATTNDGQVFYSNVVETNTISSTGLQEQMASQARIYPNPIGQSHALTLSLPLSQTQNITVSIVNVNGQQLSSLQFNGVAGENTMIIPTSALSAGWYQVLITTEEQTWKMPLQVVK